MGTPNRRFISAGDIIDIERERERIQDIINFSKNIDERRIMGQFATPYELAKEIISYGLSLLQDDEMKAIENLINRVKELEEENKLLKELSLQDAETLKKQDEVLKIYKTNFIDKDKIKNILQKYRFCKVESLKEFYKEIEELLEEQEE